MDTRIIQELLEKYTKGEASPAEQKIIEDWLESTAPEGNEWSRLGDMERTAWQDSLQLNLRAQLFPGEENGVNNQAGIRYLPWYRRLYFQVAAMLLMVLSAAAIWYSSSKVTGEASVVLQAAPANDALPGTNRAVLTLANGQTVCLDSSFNGVLANEGNIEVEKKGDQLRYNPSGKNAGALALSYNTLATPKGGQYRLVLPDGSKVWLNAASRIRYPLVFSATAREVEVNGEAYFEIAKQLNGTKRVPFVVHVVESAGNSKQDVEVLGTHFNINSYDDEVSVNTTLLEGRIKITQQASSPVILNPGDQAQAIAGKSLRVLNNVDVDEVVAWKNGLFLMTKAPIHVVLRQLARWYDVELEYKGRLPEGRISGDFPRNLNLSEVLKVLKLSGVNFKIEGKKIIVES